MKYGVILAAFLGVLLAARAARAGQADPANPASWNVIQGYEPGTGYYA